MTAQTVFNPKSPPPLSPRETDLLRTKKIPTSVEKSYFAGFFDGEGSITINRNAELRVYIGQVKPEVLYWIKGYYGGTVSYRKVIQERRKPYYVWQATCKNARAFLKDILPFLKIKDKQANLALEHQQTMRRHGYNITTLTRMRRTALIHEIRRLSIKSRNKCESTTI